MAVHDKQKRAWGGAIKRTKPSYASTIIAPRISQNSRVLDFGCGYGFDADHYGWSSFDPYYRPTTPEGVFDFIVCINVLNALSRNNRHKAILKIQSLLNENGIAFLAVPRDLPKSGKLGIHHSLQNYVVLKLPSIHSDERIEIYELRKQDVIKDTTQEYLTPRDKRSLKN